MRLFALAFIGGLLLISLSGLVQANAQTPQVSIKEQTTFVDSSGRETVVGTVKNVAMTPLEIHLSARATDGNTSAILDNTTTGRVVWPMGEVPFKITAQPGTHIESEAFVGQVRNVSASQYDFLTLNYTNMGVGTDRALVGTVKNTGPFDVHNVSVFASVHDSTGAQIDTVKSNVIPVLHPGETEQFVAAPDPSIKNKVLFYSCAGLDADAPITTVDTGTGAFIAFQLEAIAKISDFKYDDSKDGISVNVTPYGFDGGPFTIKLAQISKNPTIAVSIDNQVSKSAQVSSDGKTVSVSVFVPKGEHNVLIQGITTVPEFSTPLSLIAGLVLVSTLLFSGRARWLKLRIT